MTVHNDPDLTPAQEKLGALTREVKDAFAAGGYPTTEAHAKTADFKAAVLASLYDDLKRSRDEGIPQGLDRWWRRRIRNGWAWGYEKAIDRVFTAMMRQQSWAHNLRNSKKAGPRD
jgi:hypothetical protein